MPDTTCNPINVVLPDDSATDCECASEVYDLIVDLEAQNPEASVTIHADTEARGQTLVLSLVEAA